MLPINFNHKRWSDYIVHLVLPVVAILLPLLLASLNLQVAPRMTTTIDHLFELFGFCMWCVLAYAAYREFGNRSVRSWEMGTVVFLPFLVSFVFLILLVEYHDPSYDYEQYEIAFQAIVNDGNPYESTHYLYPPPFAQVMVSVSSFAEKYFPSLNPWLVVFYIHQCLQFFLANVAYQFSRRFSVQAGLTKIQGTMLVSALFLFNYPLLRTFHLNQVNLYVLNAILMACVLLVRFPMLGGAAVAVGGLVKLYPFVLGIPLFFMKKWKSLFGIFAGVGLIILVQTQFGSELLIWKQFVRFYLSFPVERESSLWFRNTSLLSFIRNVTFFTNLSEKIVFPLFTLVMVSIFIWLGFRFIQREKIYRLTQADSDSDALRNFGHLTDFSVLTLLLAPSAWDHHFIVALPLAIWVFALRWRDSLGLVSIGIICIFVLPPYSIFPLSYLRLVGVFILLVLSNPNPKLQVTTAARA